MSRYYNNDFIEHSSGPWTKHKYLKKIGSGDTARYIYASAKNALSKLAGKDEPKQADSLASRYTNTDTTNDQMKLDQEVKRRSQAAYNQRLDSDRMKRASADRRVAASTAKDTPRKQVNSVQNKKANKSKPKNTDPIYNDAYYKRKAKVKKKVDKYLAKKDKQQRAASDAYNKQNQENVKYLKKKTKKYAKKAGKIAFKTAKFLYYDTPKAGYEKAAKQIKNQNKKTKAMRNVQ